VKSKVVAFVALLLIFGGAFCVVSEPFQIAFCDPGNKPHQAVPQAEALHRAATQCPEEDQVATTRDVKNLNNNI